MANGHDGIRRNLEERLEVLRRRTGAVERDLRRLQDPDSQERATEAENDRVLEALDGEGRAEMEAIESALGKMAAGSYGICSACGDPIAEGRLEVLPFAPHCIDCAE